MSNSTIKTQPLKPTKSLPVAAKPRQFTLQTLTNANAKNRKRVGRGIGSKHGKTAGRGHKGQRSRSGHKIGFAFEGGQTPFYRRIPKRGFTNFTQTRYLPIALKRVVLLGMAKITPQILHTAGLLDNLQQKYKILGTAVLTKPLQVHAHAYSKTAKAAILAGKGQADLLA